MFGRSWRSRFRRKRWDLRCCRHPFERLEDRGGAVSEGNGETFVILSVEEVRAKVTKIQSEEALSVEEVRATVIRTQSRALSVEEVRATATVKNSVFVVEDSR